MKKRHKIFFKIRILSICINIFIKEYKNLVKFLSPYNIRINAVAPGFTISEWHKDKSEDFFDKISAKIGVHRWAEGKEIAKAYLFAIENEYLNGSILNINGGYSYFKKNNI